MNKTAREYRIERIKKVLCNDKASKEDYRYAILLGILELIESQNNKLKF